MEIDSVEVDSQELSCIVKDCDCRDFIKYKKQLKQGNFGMCWFVSVLNALFISEGLSTVLRPFINKDFLFHACDKPETVAKHLVDEVAAKPCVSPHCTQEQAAQVKDAAENRIVFEKILIEYFSDEMNPLVFSKNDYNTGGFPFKVICPYLVRLGYPICNMKHVLYNFQWDPTKTIDPRSVKLGRLCQDYLAYTYTCFKNVDIFILTMFDSFQSQLEDISSKNMSLYLAKYICLILDDQLHVYTLDCAFFASNNNHFRKSGHALCCATCHGEGYLLNSYYPAKDGDATCSVVSCNWYKWNTAEYYYHTIQNDKCTAGRMITAEPSEKEKFTTTTSEYTYHRNIGTNTFVYIRSITNFMKNESIENIHKSVDVTMQAIKNIFTSSVKPYMYLLDTIARQENVTDINYEYNSCTTFTGLTNHTVLQEGMIKQDMQVFIYTVTVPVTYISRMIDLGQELFPDDIMISHSGWNQRQFSLIVNYFRQTWGSCPKYGGRGRKTRR